MSSSIGELLDKNPLEISNKYSFTVSSVGESKIDEPVKQSKILNSILDQIGNTPIVRINKIGKSEGLECEILAKCEFFNAGGSVKDRIGKRMVDDAELSGRIKPGDTLIEPTSGNTGIGLALSAAIKGYHMIITLPEKMSKEKVDVLKALGAEIVRTPTEAASDSPESHIGVAKRMHKDIPNSHILDQYTNPSNPLAHYDGTAEELLDQCDGKIDMVVIAAGTGGTISGVAKKLKERLPNVVIVGVDPYGSILAEPDNLNDYKRLKTYKVEGIGYDFVPEVLDRHLVDQWIKTDDRESFLMARRLIREEGLLCGGSSGAAMVATIKAAKNLRKDQRCVVILPDSVRNYMTKFLSDDWMWENDFVDGEIVQLKNHGAWWASKMVSDLRFPTPITVSPNIQCKRAIEILTENGIDMIPVVSEDGKALGIISEGNLMSKLVSGRIKPDDLCSEAMFKEFYHVELNTSLNDLARIFDHTPYALIISQQQSSIDGEERETPIVSGVVTRIDLLNFISSNAYAMATDENNSNP